MNEFWALVLGSVLAVVGGALGTLFAQWLSNIKEKRQDKKDAYKNILMFCYELKYIDNSSVDITFDRLINFLSEAQLYASDKVANEYAIIHDLARKMISNDKNGIEKLKDDLDAHIDVIAAQMKKELKLKTKRSKELLSITIDKKEKEKKINGN